MATSRKSTRLSGKDMTPDSSLTALLSTPSSSSPPSSSSTPSSSSSSSSSPPSSSSTPSSTPSSSSTKRKEPPHVMTMSEAMLAAVLAEDDPELYREYKDIKNNFDDAKKIHDAFAHATAQLLRAKQHYGTLKQEEEALSAKIRDQDIRAKIRAAKRGGGGPIQALEVDMWEQVLQAMDDARLKCDELSGAFETMQNILQRCKNTCREEVSHAITTLEAAKDRKKTFFKRLSAIIRNENNKRHRRDEPPRESTIPAYPPDPCAVCLDIPGGQKQAFLDCECTRPACAACIKSIVAHTRPGAVPTCPSCPAEFEVVLTGFPGHLKVERGFVQIPVDTLRDVELFFDVKSLFRAYTVANKTFGPAAINIVPAGLPMDEGSFCEVDFWEDVLSGDGTTTWGEHLLVVKEHVASWRAELGVVEHGEVEVIEVGP
ncbi:hypothetical protein HK102_003857 [Quaeritorhiza haematococci]|nr:hypothetical protein HK102_003857 [Quaeritorhiza haematococci]